MRKLIFLFYTSYPILTIFFLSFFTARPAHGQPLAIDKTAHQNDFLYGWWLASPGANVAGGIVLMKTDAVKASDSTTLVTNEADSSDNKETTPANNSQVAIIETNPSDLSNSNHANLELSGAIFDDETDVLINKYAEIISVAPEEVNNFHLYKFIDQWYGVRYKWGGSDNSGIDCSGFSQKLYGSIYSLTILRTAREQHRSCEIIHDFEDASEGDLVFFRMHHFGISHVGVYLANGYFVHASRSRGVMISNLNEKYWHRRYAGCGRIEKEDLSGTESSFMQ